MDTDIKSMQKKEQSEAGAPPRQIYTVPLPEDTERCKGCNYPGVGFICWSSDGSCMRIDMDRISRPGR